MSAGGIRSSGSRRRDRLSCKDAKGGSADMPRPSAKKSAVPPPSAFDWNSLARFKQEKRFLDHYPDDFRTFWSPRDDLHGMLAELLASAQHSLVLNMFGYDDDDLDAI